MYKAVIFDLDDTLYDYASLNESAIKKVADFLREKHHVDFARFNDAFSKARKETKEVLGDIGASHNRMLYFQKTLECLSLNPVEDALTMYETYWGYMLNNMRLSQGALELLDFCKSKSLKIGICSDLTAHIQHRKLQKLGITTYIDAIVTSEEAGREKPSSQMFSMILSKLGVSPSEALYIGDSYKKDVLGAEKMGIQAVWYKGDASDKRSINSLNEVKKYLICG